MRSGGAKVHLTKARDQLREAERQLQVSERRWKKKKQTYHHSGKYSVWDQPSIVKRVEHRMFDADIELGKARALVNFRRDRYILFRSYYMLTKRMDENPEAFVRDYDMMGFWLRAVSRIADMPTAPALWRSAWPATYGNIWEWNAQHFGMALSWGLTHVDALKTEVEAEVAGATCAGTADDAATRPDTRQLAAERFEAERKAAAAAFANS